MKVITNALIEQASGKLGTSVVFFRNANRQCARIYVVPSNPETDLQLLVRKAMSDASKWWSTALADSERHAWKSFAANVSEISKALGLPYKRTGQQLAVASYQLTVLTGGSSSQYDLPTDYSAVPAPTSCTAVYDKSDGTLTLNTVMPTVPTTQELFILPKVQVCNSAAQTPKESNARLLKHASEASVLQQAIETGGTLPAATFTKVDFPGLSILDTAVKGYLFMEVRAANSGMSSTTILKVPVTIQA